MVRLKVTSSAIDFFEYERKEEELKVHFSDGSVISYHRVPQVIFESLKELEEKGESVGTYFNYMVRNHYDNTRVS